MEDLPIDLIHSILPMLPLRSLIRSRLISRHWSEVFDDPCFRAKFATDQTEVLFQEPSKAFLYSLDGAESGRTSKKSTELAQFFSLLEYSNFLEGCELAGSCNGVLYFTSLYRDQNILFNPVTKEVLEVPPVSMAPLACDDLYGLGFDCTTSTYKMVRIHRTARTDIYDCGQRICRTSKPSLYPLDTPCVYASNSLNWLINSCFRGSDNPKSREIIVSFDLAKEEFNYIPAPKFFQMNARGSELLEVGGCLALTNNMSRRHIGIWLLKENEWVRTYKINKMAFPKDLIRLFHILCTSKEAILYFGRPHYFYNFNDKKVTIRDFDISSFRRTICFKPSFICLGKDATRATPNIPSQKDAEVRSVKVTTCGATSNDRRRPKRYIWGKETEMTEEEDTWRWR